MLDAQAIFDHLRSFTGSEQLYRHSLRRSLLYTEGIKALAEIVGGYWIIDAISSHQPACLKDPKGMLQEHQFWTLKVDLEAHNAVLSCERDSGDVAFTQDIEYTDLKLPEVKLYVCRADDQLWTLMLPSEY